MNIVGMAIGATGLLLLAMVAWMLVLSVRKKRIELERKEREIANRKAIEKHRKKERDERVAKAEAGNIPTMLFLAKEAERTNYKEALYWYDKAAKADNITGMYGMVRISQRFSDDLILKEQAKFWLTAIAAHEGDLEKHYEMAESLFSGRGTDKNIPKAVAAFKKAAQKNHIPSILWLGDWAKSYENPKPNPSAAYNWYKRAAVLRSNKGRRQLGQCYLEGVGCKSSNKRACYWFERAGEKGDLEAMYLAGQTWMNQGTGMGNALSYIWLFIAAQLGHDGAKRLRDQVAMNIGVDTVVGLQAVTKPMVRKIRDNRVNKHSMIKALNRLYKRDLPLYEDLGEDATSESDSATQAGQAGLETTSTQATATESPGADTSVETENAEPRLDFSQTEYPKV